MYKFHSVVVYINSTIAILTTTVVIVATIFHTTVVILSPPSSHQRYTKGGTGGCKCGWHRVQCGEPKHLQSDVGLPRYRGARS